MKESALQKKVMNYLKNLDGVYARKLSDRYNSGYPDIIGCYNRLFFALELKSENGRIAPIQQYEINQIRESYGEAKVCRSLAEVEFFMSKLIEEADDE